jgi:periplasmic protein CpxP/Spy
MKSIHKTLTVAVLGTMLAGAAFAQTTATPNSGSTTVPTASNKEARREKMRAHHDKLVKELGLTADQQTQMKALNQDAKSQMQAIKNDSTLSREQKKEKIKAFRQEQMAKREAILTPDQKQKWEQMKAEHKGKRGHRGHRGQPGQ